MSQIKSITTFLYENINHDLFFKNSYLEYDLHGNVIEATDWADENLIESKTISIFDSKNQKTEEINYHSDDEISEHSVFFWNTDGLLDKIDIIFSDGSKSEKIYTRNTIENTLTITIQDEEGEFEGKEFYRFDAKKNIIEKVIYNFDNNIEENISTVYDDKDRAISQTEKDKNNRVIIRKEFTYDEKGNITLIAAYNEKGNLLDKVVTVYDEKNRITEQNIKSTYLVKNYYDDELRTKKEERYNQSGLQTYDGLTTYDENGLIMEEITPQSTIKYVYEFFT